MRSRRLLVSRRTITTADPSVAKLMPRVRPIPT
jgi:hypothetical protein